MSFSGKSDLVDADVEDHDANESSHGEHEDKPAAKKVKREKKSVTTSWDLGKMKKISVSSFKGSLLVDIREFYADKSDGELKPGKKGIALSVAQWNLLKRHIVDIDAAMESLES